LLEQSAVSVRTLPGMDELVKEPSRSMISRSGYEDLLGREPVPADHALLQKTSPEKLFW